MQTRILSISSVLLLLCTSACSSDADGTDLHKIGITDVESYDGVSGGANCPNPTVALTASWEPINKVSEGEIEFIDSNRAVIDATAGGFLNAADNPFIYIGFDAGKWDIAFKRFLIRVNSGDSGIGDVRLARVDAASLDEVTTMPADDQFQVDDWATDNCELNEGGLLSEPVTAVGEWYDYNDNDMTLSPTKTVYVLKRPDASAIKFRILNYYHGDASGKYEIEWDVL